MFNFLGILHFLIILMMIVISNESVDCSFIKNCDDQISCPNGTVPISNLIAPTIYPFHTEFTRNMEAAGQILRKYPGVLSTNNMLTFHVTLNCIVSISIYL